MSDRDTRMKASDVFKERQPVFGQKVPFEEAFPEIDDVRVEVAESGHGMRGKNKDVHIKGHLGEYIDCSNPLCYRGGFSIGAILRDMVKDRKEQFETTKGCQGYEGSPKGRRKYGSCPHLFRVLVTVKYKANDE